MYVVTIDGPAASGKSTAARGLADRLGLKYLDTGAMYRAITLRALRVGVALRDSESLAQCARGAKLEMLNDGAGLCTWLDGRDVSAEIRSIEVTENVHYIARTAGVREVLVDMQRRFAEQLGEVVTEGRDQGTVVFPDANVKFYLIAAPDVRARRRCEEMVAHGEQAEYERIYQAILTRDRRDETRLNGPLAKPAGAIEIDTTNMSIEQVIETMASGVERRR
ncbi:MAG: (d)CMP kinase [Planctomycetes bacterium]|nr:(d)CMP kinase [Planctomycetota bacterium]